MSRFTDDKGNGLLTWSKAMNNETQLGKFLPSREQAIKLGLEGHFWTSTTYPKAASSAYITNSEIPVMKNELRFFVMVDKLESKQRISHIVGDTEMYNK